MEGDSEKAQEYSPVARGFSEAKGVVPRATLEQKIYILDFYHSLSYLQRRVVSLFKDHVRISTTSFCEWVKHEHELRDKYARSNSLRSGHPMQDKRDSSLMPVHDQPYAPSSSVQAGWNTQPTYMSHPLQFGPSSQANLATSQRRPIDYLPRYQPLNQVIPESGLVPMIPAALNRPSEVSDFGAYAPRPMWFDQRSTENLTRNGHYHVYRPETGGSESHPSSYVEGSVADTRPQPTDARYTTDSAADTFGDYSRKSQIPASSSSHTILDVYSQNPHTNYRSLPGETPVYPGEMYRRENNA